MTAPTTFDFTLPDDAVWRCVLCHEPVILDAPHRCPLWATEVPLRVRRIGSHGLPLPAYATDGAAGLDLRAALASYCMLPGERRLIPCGFAFEIPSDYEGQVRPRSGLSRRGIRVALGTVDSDYRGEVMVCIDNDSGEAYTIALGDRVAQLVIAPVARALVEEVAELSETQRVAGGFGSTGR